MKRAPFPRSAVTAATVALARITTRQRETTADLEKLQQLMRNVLALRAAGECPLDKFNHAARTYFGVWSQIARRNTWPSQ